MTINIHKTDRSTIVNAIQRAAQAGEKVEAMAAFLATLQQAAKDAEAARTDVLAGALARAEATVDLSQVTGISFAEEEGRPIMILALAEELKAQ